MVRIANLLFEIQKDSGIDQQLLRA